MTDAEIIWDEVNKVNAETSQGQQSLMVEIEMWAWKAETPWSKGTTLKDIIDAYAETRGWKQSPVDGFELVY